MLGKGIQLDLSRVVMKSRGKGRKQDEWGRMKMSVYAASLPRAKGGWMRRFRGAMRKRFRCTSWDVKCKWATSQ